MISFTDLLILILTVHILRCVECEDNHLQSQEMAASSLRMIPPPMSSDMISPECREFTIGHWRLQELYSPNFPHFYSRDTDCVLYLEAPIGFCVKLTFRGEFIIENSTNCMFDFLELRDGPFAYSPLIGRYCGNKPPHNIVSTTQFLWLRFKSDNTSSAYGFRVIYSYVKNDRLKAGSSLRAVRRIPINLEPEGTTNGVFSSNDVPIDNVTDSNYPVDQTVDYTWELFTHLGYNINLTAISMTSNHARCHNSFIDVYQDTTLDKDRVVRLCGTIESRIFSLTSKNNRLFVRLFGNTLNTKPDLVMTYTLLVSGKDCTQNFVSCGEFCISEQLRCNGVVNCPDGGDERNCPDVNTNDTDESSISIHTIVLGTVCSVVFMCILFGSIILCLLRHHWRLQRKEHDETMQQARGISGDPNTPDSSSLDKDHHINKGIPLLPSHCRMKRNPEIACKNDLRPMHGTIAGSIYTDENMYHNRHSYRLSTSPDQGMYTKPSEAVSTVNTFDSSHVQHFRSVDAASENVSPQPCYILSDEGLVIGMSSLPSCEISSTSTTSPAKSTDITSSHLCEKDATDTWSRYPFNERFADYHYFPCTTKDRPPVGFSKPFPIESNYIKSVQALKDIDKKIMEETSSSSGLEICAQD